MFQCRCAYNASSRLKKKKNEHLRKLIVPEIVLFNSYSALISANWKIFRHYWTLEKGRRVGVSKSNWISHLAWHKGTLHVIVLLNIHNKLKQIILTTYESCTTKPIYCLFLNNTFFCVFLYFISVSWLWFFSRNYTCSSLISVLFQRSQ